MSDASDKSALLVHLTRDLMILTREEMETVWTPDMRAAAALAAGHPWEELVPATHNPIYYIAEKVVFANVEGDPMYLHAPTHRDRLCAALLAYYLAPAAAAKDGFAVFMQRDSFKSTFMHIVMVLFVLLREKRLLKRDTRVLLVHYKLEQASQNLIRLKTILANSEFLKMTYPEMCLGAADEGKMDGFFMPGATAEQNPVPSVKAIGITGDVTGMHVNHIFFSDLVTEEARTSKVIRLQIESKHEAMLYILGAGQSKKWYDGTFYHIHDLWHKMMAAKIKDEPLYVILRIPAHDPETDVYSLPVRHSKENLEFMRQAEIARTGNDFMYCLQMLLQARSSRFIAGDRSWFRWCKQEEVPPSAWFVILCDGAWKGTHNAGSGDFASIQVWAFERRGLHLFGYLIDGTHTNEYTSFDGAREICRLMKKYDVIHVGVEEHGGHSFRTTLEDEAAKRGLMLDLIDFKIKQSGKQGRMSTFLKDVQGGLIFITSECDPILTAALLDQTDEFPQCVDELCDALDAAAYQKDPNVVERYAPIRRSVNQSHSYRTPAADLERRTRHCGA